MKKFLTILLTVISASTLFAQQTWSETAPYYAGHQIIDFQFLPDFAFFHMDGSNAVIKGIYVSKDDGLNWTRRNFPTAPGGAFEPFKQIHYTDSSNATVMFEKVSPYKKTFYSTSDGGATLNFLSDTTFSAYKNTGNVAASPCESSGMRFAGQNFIYGWSNTTEVSTNNNVYLITTSSDGGQTWNDISHVWGSQGGQVYDLKFIDEDHGFLAISLQGSSFPSGYSRALMKTTDGGMTWDTIRTLQYWIRNLEFTDVNTGYIARESPTGFSYLEKTTDGGVTWDTLFDKTASWKEYYYGGTDELKYTKALEFSDANHGILTGLGTYTTYMILRTTDGGQTWIEDSVDANVNGNSGSQPLRNIQLFGNTGGAGLVGASLVKEGAVSFPTALDVELSEMDVVLFPNPVRDAVTIRTSNREAKDVHISDIFGRMVYSGRMHGSEISIETSGLENGLYFVTIISRGTKVVRKMQIIE